MDYINAFLWKVGWLYKRTICLFNGCDISYQSSWNMPDDWHSPEYCDRCDACDDVYGIEETPYRVLYKSDGFIFCLRKAYQWSVK